MRCDKCDGCISMWDISQPRWCDDPECPEKLEIIKPEKMDIEYLKKFREKSLWSTNYLAEKKYYAGSPWTDTEENVFKEYEATVELIDYYLEGMKE